MQEIQIRAADGHQFNLRIFAGTAPRAVFIICPAMGVMASYYDRFAEALAQQGLAVAVTDLRGQGTSSLRASREVDWGYATMVEQDWPAMTAQVQAQWSGLPLYFLGHSQGGQLSLLFLAHQPAGVSGAVIIACGSTYFRGWPFPQSLKILAQTQFVRVPAATLGYFPGNKLGFGGRQARSEMGDWANAAVHGRYDLICAGMDYEAGLKKVLLPVGVFSLEGDDFAPAGAAAFLASKIPSARHIHLGAAELPVEARDHFRWSRQPDAVIPYLLKALDLS
ncbi:MAG: alpha/beta fold hydrolase [Pedobacter sp.]|nr:alpha/beta fold hydrolase [Pedobacter sp.]